MTGLDDDREFDDFLARRSMPHRRLADRDHAEPPAELDRLVLNKAREAINVPGDTPMYRAPRWALPVALAATVVLAFAVVLHFSRMNPKAAYPTASIAQELSAPITDPERADADRAFRREAAPTSPPSAALSARTVAPESEARATASGDAVGAAAAAAEEKTAAAEPPKHTDPKAWLQEIQQLSAAGKKAEAERELAEFRKAFPREATTALATDRRPAQ